MSTSEQVVKILRPNTVPYAAVKLGCTLPLVYAYIKTGQLRHYRISRTPGKKGVIRITDEAIADLIKNLETASAQVQ